MLLFSIRKKNIFFIILSVILIVSCKNDNHKFTNQLINESSPYLLQHAHNPVNWYPWDVKYLEKAKKEKKLVLLSIGYASCHWCHVMEKETFENEEIANFMNQHFINIKVDREEHPNVDKTYLTAVQVMTGNGGWPLNCVLLPNGQPVWGGTYFNKEEWLTSLKNIHEIYTENPKNTDDFAKQLTKDLISLQNISTNNDSLKFTPKKINDLVLNWNQKLDTVNGGFLSEKQFPRPNSYQFLLRYAYQTKNKKLLHFVFKTLNKIALGGLNDHLEGGFARYTIDNKWQIPHFEKMLYDNAQLVSLFSYAYQISKNKLYKETVINTLNFIENEFYNNGLYFSSLNADSFNKTNELEEGAYYTWDRKDLESLFNEKDYPLFNDYFGIDNIKTVEGKHALVKLYNDNVFVKKHQLNLDSFKKKVNSWKSILLNERKKRKKPELDNKILTSWNALLLQAFTDAYKVFGNEKFKVKAIESAIALKNNAISENWEVYRSINVKKKKIKGYLEDYAQLIHSYISLYQITLDEKWLTYSNKLSEFTLDNFLRKDQNIFNYTSKNDVSLISKNIDIEDIVIPSSNSVMNKNLFYLGHYYSNNSYLNLSKKILHNLMPKIEKYPHIYSNWLDNYLNYSSPFYEIAICGENAFLKSRELQNNYIPNYLLSGSTKKSNLPLLENRFIDNKTFIYVCVNKACKLPTEDVNKAISLIK